MVQGVCRAPWINDWIPNREKRILVIHCLMCNASETYRVENCERLFETLCFQRRIGVQSTIHRYIYDPYPQAFGSDRDYAGSASLEYVEVTRYSIKETKAFDPWLLDRRGGDAREYCTNPDTGMVEVKKVQLLILGAGWTSTFLIPLLERKNVSYAATTTNGRNGTIKFVFVPGSSDLEQYRTLPHATTVVITFPLTGKSQSKQLIESYKTTHENSVPHFIQLGSTGIWSIPQASCWVDRASPYDKTNGRAIAEDELMSLGGCSLNLSGLWGGTRQPRDFVSRVATSKEQLKAKTSLHMVHGEDVARAIFALHESFTPGERWMLTDTFVYGLIILRLDKVNDSLDWWALIMGWGDAGEAGKDRDATGPQLAWVQELMFDSNVMALPRSMETLGRCYDGRDFWHHFGLAPVRARI